MGGTIAINYALHSPLLSVSPNFGFLRISNKSKTVNTSPKLSSYLSNCDSQTKQRENERRNDPLTTIGSRSASIQSRHVFETPRRGFEGREERKRHENEFPVSRSHFPSRQESFSSASFIFFTGGFSPLARCVCFVLRDRKPIPINEKA